MKNWFNVDCYRGRNQLAAYLSEFFENNSEFVDVAIRNKKNHEDPITVRRSSLINFLQEIYSIMPISSGGSTSLAYTCEKPRCLKQLVFTYHSSGTAILNIINSDQQEFIILEKDDLQEFIERFNR